jgi:hypothetical protein
MGVTCKSILHFILFKRCQFFEDGPLETHFQFRLKLSKYSGRLNSCSRMIEDCCVDEEDCPFCMSTHGLEKTTAVKKIITKLPR